VTLLVDVETTAKTIWPLSFINFRFGSTVRLDLGPRFAQGRPNDIVASFGTTFSTTPESDRDLVVRSIEHRWYGGFLLPPTRDRRSKVAMVAHRPVVDPLQPPPSHDARMLAAEMELERKPGSSTLGVVGTQVAEMAARMRRFNGFWFSLLFNATTSPTPAIALPRTSA
jgi:hypothetical protein